MRKLLIALVFLVAGCATSTRLTSTVIYDMKDQWVSCYTIQDIDFYRLPETKNCPKQAKLEKKINKLLHIVNDKREWKDPEGNIFPKVIPKYHFPRYIVFTPRQPYSYQYVHGLMNHGYNMGVVWHIRLGAPWQLVNHEIWHGVLYKTGWVIKKKKVKNKSGLWEWREVVTGDGCHESITWRTVDPFYKEQRLGCR